MTMDPSIGAFAAKAQLVPTQPIWSWPSGWVLRSSASIVI
jgi:hypothetical protein